ncbi:MAG: ATP-dependent zinc metalloprotease FtsH [Deltaproteobacteria bacterium]|nr:ATP-dependent zinc metalloprotease FtsH [Deltaproteobacteria bacterium]
MTVLSRTVLVLIVVFLLLSVKTVQVNAVENDQPSLSYKDFLGKLNNDELSEINQIQMEGGTIYLTDKSGNKFSTFSSDIPGLLPQLIEKNVVLQVKTKPKFSTQEIFFQLLVPVLLIFFAWLIFRSIKKSNKKKDEFASKKAIKFQKGATKVTFKDVAGIPEAKEELLEIVDFLKKPDKFSMLGAVLPKGVLFQGPPGTGKTLLARAVAGEAAVPFYSISGSDFIEMFVGVGASRVRELFSEAKKNAPCIIFIDEIDAVGGHRGDGVATGSQDERGQTLNALLVEMDGFSSDAAVIIIGATNRPDSLDPALLRAGRFDRQINILSPDIKGRFQILLVHSRKIKLSKNVELEKIARSTPGFTGAELAALANEAAIVAVRKGKKAVETNDFEVAIHRILLGIERKGMIISEQERNTMAFHEAGHAIVAKFVPETDPVSKVSIIPRGRALGHTLQLPLTDRHSYSKEFLLSKIIIFMGGRAAEEIILNQQTTGAEDDFYQAGEIANKMVCRWGMNPVIGAVSYSHNSGRFLGDQNSMSIFSEETARTIDHEVKEIIDECYNEAINILTREKDFLIHMAETLLVTETLDLEEMEIVHTCIINRRLEKKEKESAVKK